MDDEDSFLSSDHPFHPMVLPLIGIPGDVGVVMIDKIGDRDGSGKEKFKVESPSKEGLLTSAVHAQNDDLYKPAPPTVTRMQPVQEFLFITSYNNQTIQEETK